MQPLKYLGRAVQLVLDCSVILLAIAFVVVSALVAAVATIYGAFVFWVVHHGDAKARSRASWQQGI
jgi:Flp pilus assembly protein TadB